MAQSGYTPIQLYASSTTGNSPSALTNSSLGAELAINYTDGKLFYKDNLGAINVLATSGIGTNVTWNFGSSTAVVSGTGALQVPASTTTNRPGTGTLITGNLSITGLTGQFTVSPALSSALLPNQAVVITGTLTGSGTISGYSSGTTYYVVPGSSTTSVFTLSTSINGTGVTTTTGTVTGLTFTLGVPAAGMLRFNTTTTQFEGYNGSTWASVGGASIVNDTTTATAVFPLFSNTTSGTALTIYTSSTQYEFFPSIGLLQTPYYAATGSTTSSLQAGAFGYGTLGYSDTNLLQTLVVSQNAYVQSILQNTNAGFLASADMVVSNNLGTATTYYGDFGINSSKYGQFSGTGGTGGVSSTTLTITAVSNGGLGAGSVLASPNVTVSYQLTSTAAAVASPTLNSGGTSGTNTFGVNSIANILVGQLITGTNLPVPSFVGAITGTTITVVSGTGAASNFTGIGSGTYNFYTPGGVGTYLLSTAQTIANGTSLTATVPGSFSLPNATYLSSASGDLVLGTYTSNGIHFVINNGSTDAMAIDTSGNVSSPLFSASNGVYYNKQTITSNVNIASGSNGQSTGPITLGTGVTFTIAPGSRWVLL